MTGEPRADETCADEPRAAELRSRWSALHHGIDPTRVPLLQGWLQLMWSGGRLLARRGVPPTAVTAGGALSATIAVGVARRAPAVAGAAVLVAALCDGLDGAVAVVGNRATRSGAVADAIADRYSDAAFAAVLWRCGVPGRLAAAAGVLAWSVDGVRRLRRVPARITVAERPTFTICALLACAVRAAGVLPVLPCALVWIALCLIGLGQLRRAQPAGPSS